MDGSDIYALFAGLLDFSEASIYALVAVFARVGAVVALLPGFGERTVPPRIKLAAAIAVAALVWPAVSAQALADGAPGFFAALPAEAATGLMIGLTIRMTVMALQLAGSIAAQATSVSQIFGAGATPDPMPAIGSILFVAGIALAMALGLHVKAVRGLVESYSIAPYGAVLSGEDVATWGVARASEAFALAFSLAAPYAVASFAYNVALGAINRAMPQLMVAFVGAPAITAGALLLLAVSAPVALRVWSGKLDLVLSAPLGFGP